MVETSLLEQEPEPDIRSLSLRNNHNQQQQQHEQPTLSSQVPVAEHDDAIQQSRLNPTPIKEKDFADDEKPTVVHSNKAIFPALTRLRRPYQERDLSDGPLRSQSTPPASRHHVNVSANTKTKDDTPSAFATAEPLPPTRLNDVGPPRPPKNIAELFAPDRKLARDPGWTQSFVNTVKCSYFNLMIFLVPVAWALHLTHQNDVIVFVFTFLSVIPLANLLSFATEQLALRVGEAIGGLLNASFGNAVELLISILALVKGDIPLVQASMIGSILSNTLLVLGMCYFAGGLRFHEQLYQVAASQLQISLLGISIAAIILPAAYHFATSPNAAGVNAADITDLANGEERHLLSISRGLAFLLLSVYAMYLVFILYTHAYLFKLPRPGRPHLHVKSAEPHPNHAKVFPKPHWLSSIQSRSSNSSASGEEERDNALSPVTTRDTAAGAMASPEMMMHDVERGDYVTNSAPTSAALSGYPVNTTASSSHDDDDEKEETPKVKALFALFLLLGVTAITGVTAEFLVDSVNGLTETTSISKEFVGLILFPLVGNATEHVAAVTVSVKDKLNLSMAIAVGSSIQVSLFILPLLVLIGWMIGQPMSLFFDVFETITLAISLLLVNFAISDGRTNYLEGYVLMISYVMIAVVCWYYDPAS
ncbi:hypothetical protein QFC20_006381 [Naganishia adeliensis]|uniref:Uncharacterized protein n=1 Tax=Naganishia adeliensis TaxID=92952 RepID=A0ACC2VBR7_9TREE|nr:hypothetical protein QFC20_006381 [Naganishia adeliensis]